LLNQPAPRFLLPDLQGNLHNLTDFAGQIVLLNFWSAECDWCERADRELDSLLRLWHPLVLMLTIASNPLETLELIKRVAEDRELKPVLQDRSQKAARAYGVTTTPYFVIIDGHGILRYQGAFDDVTFRQRLPTRNHLKEAMADLFAGRSVRLTHSPAYGCALTPAEN
jgi:peroxiredoxin